MSRVGKAANTAPERPVVGTSVWIDTPDGPMQVLRFAPSGGGRFAAVVLVPHIGGLSDLMKDMARRIASAGYLCAVPDLYHRLGRIVVDPVSKDKAVAAIRRIAIDSLTQEGIAADLAALLDRLAQDPQVRPGRRGVMAVGRTAAFAVPGIAARAADFAAFVAILGIGFVTDRADSPHRSFGRISAEMYLAYSGADEILPPPVLAEVRAALDASGVRYRMAVHPGVGHAYFIPGRDIYAPDAAEADWRAVFELFARTLGAEPSEP